MFFGPFLVTLKTLLFCYSSSSSSFHLPFAQQHTISWAHYCHSCYCVFLFLFLHFFFNVLINVSLAVLSLTVGSFPLFWSFKPILHSTKMVLFFFSFTLSHSLSRIESNYTKFFIFFCWALENEKRKIPQQRKLAYESWCEKLVGCLVKYAIKNNLFVPMPICIDECDTSYAASSWW